ncbi:hypothetical protein CONPUDRAFT_140104 [Coniophora puteana RWD-64-598 SS2]|uniref:Uncharacterized protein n=1 Tax=Coniophora puteana (strain RWD-64-598) TaxID=741705 RepID=A0A5M3M765_CONPW|nr:uncharacterized protein CONPUDRAFT_140104 [Coniophora puteana RWD-64-598 SS2]EIW75089.1 hypothetical protein CONPUDRAFT_140104 [Coniophora puteana RWD-64-598 SS2]
MAIPEMSVLFSAAAGIMATYETEGRMKDLTIRIIRKQLEEKFSLEDGALDAPEYKKPIGEYVRDATAKGQKAKSAGGEKQDEGGEDAKPRKKAKVDEPKDKKPASRAKPASGKGKEGSKPKSGAKPLSSVDDSPKKPSAKRSTSAKETPTKPTSASADEKGKRIYKSKDTVDTSDEEDVKPSSKPPVSKKSTTARPANLTKKAPTSTASTSKSPPKSAKAAEAEDSDEPDKPKSESSKGKASAAKRMRVEVSDDEDGGENEESPPKPSSSGPVKKELKPGFRTESKQAPPSSDKPGNKSAPVKAKAKDANDELSESELSSVIDEPPKKKRAKSAGKEKPTKATKTKGKRGSPDPSKEDPAVTRLKKMVLACGVRKTWKTELADKSTNAQIKRLKEILSELGMDGRPSLEKAREIKEQRELAQELEEVQAFDKAMRSRGRRSGSSAAEEDEESEEEEEVPTKRKRNARASIAAFLGDESDEE